MAFPSCMLAPAFGREMGTPGPGHTIGIWLHIMCRLYSNEPETENTEVLDGR
jgi:hypothetical protein